MTQFDASKYTNGSASTPHPTGISRSVPSSKEKLSPVGVGITVLTMGAIVLSFSSSVPGMIQQTKIESEVAGRLQQNGVTEMSQNDAAIALKSALPLLDPATGGLALASWEDVVKNTAIPPGTYFTQNAVIVKGLNGSGVGLVRGHKYGNFSSPEEAFKRFNEFNKETGRQWS